MALNLHYSSQFIEHLESILLFYDERNGSDNYSKKLLKRFTRQIALLASFPDIGRETDHPSVRILFVGDYGIEYEHIDDAIIIVDIYSCLTNPALRKYKKK